MVGRKGAIEASLAKEEEVCKIISVRPFSNLPPGYCQLTSNQAELGVKVGNL